MWKRLRTTTLLVIPPIFIEVGRNAIANFIHPSYGCLFSICPVRPQLIPNLKYIHQKRDIMPLFHILVIPFLLSPTALISLRLVIFEFFPLLVAQKIFYKRMESGGLLRGWWFVQRDNSSKGASLHLGYCSCQSCPSLKCIAEGKKQGNTHPSSPNPAWRCPPSLQRPSSSPSSFPPLRPTLE